MALTPAVAAAVGLAPALAYAPAAAGYLSNAATSCSRVEAIASEEPSLPDVPFPCSASNTSTEIPFGILAVMPWIEAPGPAAAAAFAAADEPFAVEVWPDVEDPGIEEFSKAATICSSELIICERAPPLPPDVPAPCANGLAPGLMLKTPTESPLGKVTSIPAEALKPRVVDAVEDPAEVGEDPVEAV
jgi:hypothetical protein